MEERGCYAASVCDRLPLIRTLRSAAEDGGIGVDATADGALVIEEVTKSQFDVIYYWLQCERKKRLRCASHSEYRALADACSFLGLDELTPEDVPLMIGTLIRAAEAMRSQAQALADIFQDLCTKALDNGVFKVSIFVFEEKHKDIEMGHVPAPSTKVPQYFMTEPRLFNLMGNDDASRTLRSVLLEDHGIDTTANKADSITVGDKKLPVKSHGIGLTLPIPAMSDVLSLEGAAGAGCKEVAAPEEPPSKRARLTRIDLEGRSRSQLQKICRDSGKPCSGSKDELILRIVNSDSQQDL